MEWPSDVLGSFPHISVAVGKFGNTSSYLIAGICEIQNWFTYHEAYLQKLFQERIDRFLEGGGVFAGNTLWILEANDDGWKQPAINERLDNPGDREIDALFSLLPHTVRRQMILAIIRLTTPIQYHNDFMHEHHGTDGLHHQKLYSWS
jgi:hypothetical protein